jgi:hypothetical protein
MADHGAHPRSSLLLSATFSESPNSSQATGPHQTLFEINHKSGYNNVAAYQLEPPTTNTHLRMPPYVSHLRMCHMMLNRFCPRFFVCYDVSTLTLKCLYHEYNMMSIYQCESNNCCITSGFVINPCDKS